VVVSEACAETIDSPKPFAEIPASAVTKIMYAPLGNAVWPEVVAVAVAEAITGAASAPEYPLAFLSPLTSCALP